MELHDISFITVTCTVREFMCSLASIGITLAGKAQKQLININIINKWMIVAIIKSAP